MAWLFFPVSNVIPQDFHVNWTWCNFLETADPWRQMRNSTGYSRYWRLKTYEGREKTSREMDRNKEESSEPKANNHFTCSPKTWGGGPSLHLTFQRKNSQHAGDGSRGSDLPTIPDAMNPRTSVIDTRGTEVNKNNWEAQQCQKACSSWVFCKHSGCLEETCHAVSRIRSKHTPPIPHFQAHIIIVKLGISMNWRLPFILTRLHSKSHINLFIPMNQNPSSGSYSLAAH